MLFHQPTNSIGNYSYNCYRYQDICWDYHFHRNFELIYIVSGQVRCTINGKTAILDAGDYGLCLSNEIHAYQSVGQSASWVVVFSGDFIHAFEKQIKNKVGSGFRFQCSNKVTEYLKSVLFGPTEPSIYALKSCFYAVCNAYCSAVTLMEQAGKSDLLMRSIVEFIQANYRSPISLTDVADALGYDYYYISKSFHRIFNMSFSDFLNSYRLEAAITLLTETDEKVTDIAFESGFQSIRSFNHFFKSRTGQTPVQYRSQRHMTKKGQA